MQPELASITERIACLRLQVTGREPQRSLLTEIEHGLSDGYAHALAGDAWASRAEQRLADLTRAAEQPGGASGLHALLREQGEFDGRLRALRDELQALRREHQVLRAAVSA